MPSKDLREYINTLEKEGEVQRIRKEVDWNLEAGAIIRRSYEIKAPAPLFGKLKDYSESYKIFDCTWPKDWPKEAIPVKASFDVLWPEEIQQRVLKNWKEYGYQE